ncbi:hypothetical protein SEVIR_5G371066v4 [Setaria viridis]
MGSPCRELPMDRGNRHRHLLLECRAVTIPSWRAAPSSSPHPEMRHRHSLSQSCLVDVPSLQAASSLLPRRASRHRRPSSSIVAIMDAAALQRFHLTHVLHAFYPCKARTRLAADTAADLHELFQSLML